jgi:hypothetical protein
VREALFLEEVQSPVDCRRLRRDPIGPEGGDHVVGLEGRIRGEEKLKNTPPG